MRLISPWSPRLAGGKGLPYERLVIALAEDIGEGSLACGARLPAHRELAYQLGIGLGTVTKAYAVLERRGLVQSVRGRGMFVAGLTPRPAGIVDLSINTPPQMVGDRLLAATLAAMARRLDAGTFGTYLPPAGRDDHRALLARWLAGQSVEAAPDRLLICNGTQHALAVAFAAACPPGATLLTEAITYPGAIMLARQNGLKLVGLEIDERGLRPEALERVLRDRASSTAPRILYVTPTLHNPTAASMGAGRRLDIVRLCRMHDVSIIEDDVYSIFAGPDLIPLATLAPERTLHVSGLSKALSPGLRIGSLLVPPAFLDRAMAALRAGCTTASTLACLIMEQWLADGTAASVAASIRSDAARRMALASSLLRVERPAGSQAGFHLWLPMLAAEAEAFAAAAAARGILVMPAGAPLVDAGSLEGGIRISLGSPDLDSLKQALIVLAGLRGSGQPRGYGDRTLL